MATGSGAGRQSRICGRISARSHRRYDRTGIWPRQACARTGTATDACITRTGSAHRSNPDAFDGVMLEALCLGHECVWEAAAAPRAEGSADGGRFDIGWPTATTSAVTPSAVIMAATGNTAKMLVRVTMLPSADPAGKPTLMGR